VPAAYDNPLCDVCLEGRLTRAWAEIKGTDGSQYHLVKCDSCGLVVAYPPPSPETLSDFYSRGYAGRVKKGISDVADPQANRAAIEDGYKKLRYVEKYAGKIKGRLLDVGSGHGFFLYASQKAGLDVTGIDIDEGAIQYGEAVLGVRIVAHSIESLDTFGNRDFDAVTFWQVLEHLPKPGSCVRAAASLLAEGGGVLAGSVPNIGGLVARLRGAKWGHMIPPEHIAFFNEASCTALLITAGLEPLFVGTVPFYAAPYFSFGFRSRVMGRVQNTHSSISRAILIGLHRTLTLGKRHVIYRPLNAFVTAFRLGGNSIFFVARRGERFSDTECDRLGRAPR